LGGHVAIAPVDSMNFALASSLGNSETITASYFPMVKYKAWIFPPGASAVFVAQKPVAAYHCKQLKLRYQGGAVLPAHKQMFVGRGARLV
jgi:hypothetical protein